MDGESSLKNPIFDSEIQLDCGIISDILGLFLKTEPTTSMVNLPSFRLDQMLSIIESCSCRDVPSIIEYMGSYISICLYFTYVPIAESNLTSRATLSIQMIISEVIELLEEKYGLLIVHPEDRIKQIEESLVIVQSVEFDTFNNSLLLMKEIVREIIRQVRSARDHVPKRRKSSFEQSGSTTTKDCFQIHSMYFCGLLALSHLLINASVKQHSLTNYPGITEILLLALVTAPAKNAPLLVERSGKGENHVSWSSRDPDSFTRFDRCMEQSSRLACCAMRRIDFNFLQQV